MGKKHNNHKRKYGAAQYLVGLLLLAWCALLVLSFFIMQISPAKWIRFILFFPFGILLPGYLLARNVSESDNSSQLYAFSIFFGIGICIAEYFLDSYIQIPGSKGCFFSLFGGPILSVPAFFLLLSDIKKERRNVRSFIPSVPVLIILLIAEMIAFASTALASGLPGYSRSYVDVVWNIGHIASLSHGWPAGNFQYLGKALNSNIIGMIFRVVQSRFIGATAAETMQVFSSFVFIPLLIFGIDCFGLLLTGGNKDRSFLIVVVFIFTGFLGRAFLYSYSVEWSYAVSYASYLINDIHWLFYAPNGTDIAIPGIALLLVLIQKELDNTGKSFSLMVAIVLAAFLVTGGKYVFTVCVFGAFVGTAFLQLLQRKPLKTIYSNLLLPFILTAAGFSFAFFGIISGGEVSLPAKNCDAVFMTPEDPRYETARDEYIQELAAKNYSYILIESKNSNLPVVRQNNDGYYYVYGSALEYSKIISKWRLHDTLQNCEFQTEGILEGLGGYLNNTDLNDSCILVKNAFGFFRYKETGWDGSAICFYSDAPEATYLQIDQTYEKSTSGKQPARETDWSVIRLLFEPESDGTDMDYTEQYSSISVNAAMTRTELYKNLVANTGIENSPYINLVLFLLIPVYFIACCPITAVPFVLWIKEKLSQFREISAYDSILCGTAICGLIAFFLLNVNGLSQAYFFDAAVVVIDAIGVCWICDHYAGFSKTVKTLLLCAAFIGLCSQVSFYTYTAKDGFYRVKELFVGCEKDNKPGSGYISAAEREAMDWLRMNSPADAVVATNRHYNVTDVNHWEQPRPNDYASRFYYYTAYGERQMFIGSWAYVPRTPEMQEMLRERLVVNDALFNPFCANKREIMEKNGIDYLVASAEVGTGMDMKDEDLVCVFRNQDIAVYVLRGEGSV